MQAADKHSEAADSPANRDVFVLPASFAQQRLWFIDQLDPGSPAYNVPAAFRIDGPLDHTLLERALNEIVARHEALRTTFRPVDGEPSQLVEPVLHLRVPAVDLRTLPEDGRERELSLLIAREARLPFDLTAGPLIRATLVQAAEADHALLLTLHHIITDMWSQDVLMRELTALYDAFRKNAPSPLAELPIQYADFANWQRDQMQGELLERETAYWKQKLDGLAPLELPVARPRPPLPSHDGRALHVGVSEPLTAELKKLAAREGVSLFMLLLAAWKTLLFRYTSQTDVSVGSPISNRSRAETEPLIGFFLNMLVLRTDLSGNPSFRTLLGRVRETALGAFEHNALPFEMLVDALQPARAAGQNPLFNVAFVFVHGDEKSWSLPGLTFTPMRIGETNAKFDLTLGLNEAHGKITGSLVFNTDLFDEAFIARMAVHFHTLLGGIAENPDTPVGTLPMLGGAEREQIVVEWNRTSRPYPAHKTVAALFEEQVAQTPDAVALESGDERRSYAELNSRANRIARHLRGLGVTHGACVGVCMERSPELIECILGIVKAGAAYVPLDAAAPAERLAFMIEDSAAKLVLTRGDSPAMSGRGGVQVVDYDRVDFSKYDTANLRIEGGGEDLAYVIFTSGSTGRPKGAAVPHRAIARLVINTDYVRIAPDDVMAHVSNTAFDAATFEIWGALLNGARLAVIARDLVLSPHEFLARLDSHRVTTIFLTTSLFNQIARDYPDRLRRLRHVIVGGEALDPKWIAAVLRAGAPERLLNGYGPTETTTFAIWHPIESVPDDTTPIPIGRPIANTTVYILDSQRQPVPVGVPGEICIGGDGVARGYVNRPELTAERFVEFDGARVYNTGDLGRWRADGVIEFLGRRDGQVKIRGFRIEPAEIEAQIGRHPAVRDCAVVAREDGGERRLVAYVVPRSGASVPHDLRQFLKAHLPDYMIPPAFVMLEKLPLTASGKTDRRALPAPDLETGHSTEVFVAPRTPNEAALAKIWERILNRGAVGVEDDFFEIGGHSLLAMRMFVQIRETFGRSLPLSTLFHAPTISALAALLDGHDNGATPSTLVALQPCGAEPPLFCIHGGDGGTIIYRDLGEKFGTERPLYALESPWLTGDQMHETVEEMAAFYIGQIQAVQPAGPYHLAGFSLGGAVAYEMAQQLRATGAAVGLVALFDSYNPARLPRRFGLLERIVMNLRLMRGMSFADKAGLFVKRATGKVRGTYGREKARAQKYLSRLFHHAEVAMPANLRVVRGRELSAHAWMSYRPRPYAGSVLLFVAEDPPDGYEYATDRGWSGFAEQLELFQIGKAFHETMLYNPHVAGVAAKLLERLSEKP